MSRRPVGSRMATAALGNAIGPMCAIVAIPIVTHALGVTGRGITAAGTAPLLLISAALTFGIPDAITFKLASTGRSDRTLIRLGATASFVIGIIGMGTVVALRDDLDGNQMVVAHVIALAALAIPLTLSLGAVRAGAAGLHQWRRVSLEKGSGAFFELLAIAILGISGHLTVVSATLVIAFAPLLGGAFYIGMHRHAGDDEPQRSNSRASELWVSLRGFAGKAWFGSVFGIMLSRLDQVLLVPLSSTKQLGLYAIAVNISEVPLIINNAVRDVMFSSDAERKDDSMLLAAARISSFLVLIVSLFILAGMYIFIAPIFGAGFRGSLWPLGILSLGIVCGIPGSIAGASLSARGQPGTRSLILLLASAINLLLLFVLVPKHGAIGASIATLAANVVATGAIVWILSRKYGLSPWRFVGLHRSDIRLLLGLARSFMSGPRQ